MCFGAVQNIVTPFLSILQQQIYCFCKSVLNNHYIYCFSAVVKITINFTVLLPLQDHFIFTKNNLQRDFDSSSGLSTISDWIRLTSSNRYYTGLGMPGKLNLQTSWPKPPFINLRIQIGVLLQLPTQEEAFMKKSQK